MATSEQMELAAGLGINVSGLGVHQAWNRIRTARKCLAMRALKEQGLKVGSRVKVHGSALLYRVTHINVDTQTICVSGKSGCLNPTSVELVEP